MKSFIVLDTETTGVTSADKVCQIAAALVDAATFEVQDSFTSLVDPQREIPAGAFAIHGISNEAAKGKPLLQEVFDQHLSRWFNEVDILCGHNVQFDIRMCRDHIRAGAYQILDTLTLARTLYPQWPNHKLQSVVANLRLPKRHAHDALGDVLSCIDFLQAIRSDELCDVYAVREHIEQRHQQFKRDFWKKVGL